MILDIPPLAANIAGFTGAACCLAAYAYGTASGATNPFIQHGLNLVGAVLLVVSLLVETNPASLVLECLWGVIAVAGLIKAANSQRGKHR